MNSKVQPSTANAEPVPKTTNETKALDHSEKEYNRMISQHMMYHKIMMDDLMKLTTETEAGSGGLNLVSGLGAMVETLAESNQNLLQSAGKYVDQGKQNAIIASQLDASMDETNSKLKNDIKQYDALMKKEGFANPTMDAALKNSEMVNESQKYALVIFGAFAVYLLYKTVKQL